MHRPDIVAKAAEYAKQTLYGEGSGHDWWHVHRVWQTAKRIAEAEGADLYIVQLAALLHDIADWKFNKGDDTIGPRLAEVWLINAGAQAEDINHVCAIIRDMSFKGAHTRIKPMETLEGAVVQDADRLDALGAVGIARAFAYGGFAGRVMHEPQSTPVMHSSFEAYQANQSTSINHFYEKLLLLKNQMNTSTARAIAAGRHLYMERFLEEFFAEWAGSK